MTFFAPRRVMAGVLVGASLVLAGCTVPGQPAPAGAAAAFEETTISNERVSEMYDAWRDEAGQSANRRSIVTLELMREPLLQAVEELGLNYHRSHAEQQAQMLLRLQGSTEAPSEALIDAAEAAYLVALFTMTPGVEDTLAIKAAHIEAEAATSPRTGNFSAERFIDSVEVSAQRADDLYAQGMPTWFIAFRTVNGFSVASAEWLASGS